MEDFAPEFFAVLLERIFALVGVFCCFIPGDFIASGVCFGFFKFRKLYILTLYLKNIPDLELHHFFGSILFD